MDTDFAVNDFTNFIACNERRRKRKKKSTVFGPSNYIIHNFSRKCTISFTFESKYYVFRLWSPICCAFWRKVSGILYTLYLCVCVCVSLSFLFYSAPVFCCCCRCVFLLCPVSTVCGCSNYNIFFSSGCFSFLLFFFLLLLCETGKIFKNSIMNSIHICEHAHTQTDRRINNK